MYRTPAKQLKKEDLKLFFVVLCFEAEEERQTVYHARQAWILARNSHKALQIFKRKLNVIDAKIWFQTVVTQEDFDYEKHTYMEDLPKEEE